MPLGERSDHSAAGLTAEERLRELLVATSTIVEGTDLREVLRRIVSVAVDLVDARYGALGVIGPDGYFTDFVHVGIDDETVKRIGMLPHGRGLLGEVVNTARIIRIDDMLSDGTPRAFPPNHPTMHAFLGVPIRVSDRIYGNLYLTDRESGPFTEEDEVIVTALAGAAGVAIEHAHLLEESRRRQRWSAALAEVSAALLSESSDSIMGLIVDRVVSLVDTDIAAVLVPGPGRGQFTVNAARGKWSDRTPGTVVDGTDTLFGAAFEKRAPLVTDELGLTPEFEYQGSLGPAMFIPLLASDTPLGVLCVIRERGRLIFRESDLIMATEFAQQASISIELARAQADSRQLELIELRNQIARDLHDHVIQRLFGTGLLLQGLMAKVDEDVADELAAQVDSLDQAISEIRSAVFALRTRASGASGITIRHRVFDVLRELTPMLPKAPLFTTSGPVDLFVPPDLADDITAVVRELLMNVVKHANATTTIVNLSVRDGFLTVYVEDDGCGLSESDRRSGIANLGQRADSRGGQLTLEPAIPHGTIARWTVPLETA